MPFSVFRLEAERLACRRGMAPIFSGVSFALRAGEALLVRGANGSGKSSLLRLLCGLMKPEDGAVRLLRGDAQVEEIAREAHYVGHLPAVTAALSVRQNLSFQAALFGVRAAPMAALERVGLIRLADAPVRQLSAGEKRRLALARLVTAPRPLWLLDEPGESLDTAGEALLSELAGEHRAARGLIVLATHGPAPFAATMELTLKLARAA